MMEEEEEEEEEMGRIESCLGRIYSTKKDSESGKSNELSFLKGDLVTLVSEPTEDGEHYQAVASDGSMGLIHYSAILQRHPVPLIPMPWFHSTLTRLDAEKLLNINQDGHFLVRTSQKTKGVYAVAISDGGRISHYLVAMEFSKKKLTINGNNYYNNLPELVQAHMEDKSLIGTLLSHPLGRRGTLDFHIDQDALKNIWSLPKADVELGQTLGRGEFGEVCMAKYRGMQIAAKVIHEEKQNASSIAGFLREAAILTLLKHKNLVQLVGLVYQGSVMKCILTELMSKGSLQKYLISRGRSVISQAELLSFARDVCDGMVYITSEGYLHRDLAARNVLLNSNGQAKISDFGLARKADIHVPHEGGKFPVKWTAPEALKESIFSVQSDVWSFGVLLWEIFSYGRTPYPSVPTGQVLENIEDGNIMDPPDNCPDEMYDLMCVCWEIEPGSRPSFTSLRHQLTKSFQETSETPTPSPMVARKTIPMPNVDQLISGPVAVKTYQNAPAHRKATLFLGNIIFLGLQGAGKTSLLRSLAGEPFRLVEPPSHGIDIPENYCILMDNLNWISSTSGLMYEDELVRIIVEDLLKHRNSILSKVGSRTTDTQPQRPVLSEVQPSSPSPPPPPPRRRAHSLSDTHGLAITATTITTTTENNRDVEALDIESPEGQIDEHSNQHPSRGRKGLLSKLLTKGLKHHHHHHNNSHTSPASHRKVKRHFSDSVKQLQHTHNMRPSSAGSSFLTSTSSPAPSPTNPPRFYSPLPERLTEKIRAEFNQCLGEANMPPKFLARLIDTPGNASFRVLQSLFLTENSVCVLTFDASKDILSPLISPKRKISLPEVKQNGIGYPLLPNMDDSVLCHIMAEISSVCVQWSGYQSDMTICGPRIILVGTHSDKVASSVTLRNFEILRDEIKVSPYQKYVSVAKFIVSNSSIIERSAMNDLKQFVKENLKKLCRQQVPLKWLRCVRRFQGLLKKKSYLVSLTDAKKLVSEICDISIQDPEIEQVINFLHQNQVIMHFPLIYHLRDLVISSARWFSQQVSKVFAAPSIDIEAELGPPELIPDQKLLRSKGILTNQLLDYVWRDKEAKINKDELLTVMNKMDLLCCMASETHLLPLAASIEDLTAEVSTKKKQQHRLKIAVLLVVVPALVEGPQPPHLSSLPSYDVDPVIFRFRDHVPNGLFLRLLVRCVQSYPDNFSLYQSAATFVFDDGRSLLLLTEGSSFIRLTLHHAVDKRSSPKKPTGLSRESRPLSEPPTVSPDACMAVLMFIQATINDLIRQWTPHLDFDLCVKCSCKCPPIPMDSVVDIDDALAEKARTITSRLRTNSNKCYKHYIILNDVDSLLHQLSLRCEMGNQVPLSPSLLCWFGEVPTSISPSSPTGDVEYVTDSDINQAAKVLGLSWKDLGQTLGFSEVELECFSLDSFPGKRMLKEWQTQPNKNATFFALLGALEIIQRRDIADDLTFARMLTGDALSA